MPRHPPEEKLAILERRRNVARRYLRGELQWEIAKAFEVDQGTISRDIKAIQEEWLKSAVMDLDALRAKELAKLDEIERCAMAAWIKSQENAEITKARMRGTDKDSAQTERTVKGQAGDPRFLDLVLKCVQKRCELFGLDKQPKNKATGDNPYTLSFIIQEKNVDDSPSQSADPGTPPDATQVPPQ